MIYIDIDSSIRGMTPNFNPLNLLNPIRISEIRVSIRVICGKSCNLHAASSTSPLPHLYLSFA